MKPQRLVVAVDILGHMRSWLDSPTVALLNFLATAIAIAQGAVSAAKWVHRLTRAEDRYQRLYKMTVLSCFVAIAIIAPVSWQAVVTEARAAGNSGILALLYPVMMNGTAFSGALVLLADDQRGQERRLPVAPCGAVILGLGFAMATYIFSSASVW